MTPKFHTAYNATMGHEGGYVNDPDDRGGETYGGVSRRWHPGWPGWAIIDSLKQDPDFPGCLNNHPELKLYKSRFYHEHYWQRCNCDMMPELIAGELFDTGVNMGPDDAVKFLQQSLNKLNRNQQLFYDLKVDGWAGDLTVNAVEVLEKQNELELLYKVMNIYQGHRYLSLMDDSPKQEKFARGWLNRVTFAKA